MNEWNRWFIITMKKIYYLFFWGCVNNHDLLYEDNFYKNQIYEIMKKIRNNVSLNSIEMKLIKILSKKELLELIEIYNINTKQLVELILFMEEEKEKEKTYIFKGNK